MEMKAFHTDDALRPSGHYVQAIEYAGVVYCSGILPFDRRTGKFVEGDVETQCKTVFENLEAVLEAAGTSKDKVIKTTVFIPDIALWPKVNALYAEFFGNHKPCRSIVPTTKLHFGSHIELEAIAAK